MIKNKKIILRGIPASVGVAEGRVKKIKTFKDEKKFNQGDILVTKITDPTMVLMMAKAGAIVCDIGGVTSHPAIVSREMGIPCVVNVKSATKKLKDGALIRVDGKRGEIILIEK